MQSQSEQWWCTEYAEEINDALRKREFDRFTFGFKAPQIEWRMHIVRYMLRVAEKHKLARRTIHLAVYYLDIFLDNHIIRLWRLCLVALTSIRIAAKIEEKDFSSPKVEALNATANYKKEDYNILETIILKLFEFDMNLPTASTFGTYFVEFAVDETDYCSNNGSYDSFVEFKKKVQSEVMYFVDLSLFDLSLQHEFMPSKLAAMCVAATRFKRNIEPIWTQNLIKVTRYTWNCIEKDFQRLFDIKLKSRTQLEAELKEGIILEARNKDNED